MYRNIRILGKAAVVAVIAVPALSVLTGCAGSGSDTSVSKSIDDYTCQDLADQAVAMSAKQAVQILKINGLQTATDFRPGFSGKSDDPKYTTHVFTCWGNAIWSSGDTGSVTLALEVDSDGQAFVSYKG